MGKSSLEYHRRNFRRYQLAELYVAQIPGVTIGYIGNVYHMGTAQEVDDRSWHITLPHGKHAASSGSDCIGQYGPNERGMLAMVAANLLKGFLCATESDVGAKFAAISDEAWRISGERTDKAFAHTSLPRCVPDPADSE